MCLEGSFTVNASHYPLRFLLHAKDSQGGAPYQRVFRLVYFSSAKKTELVLESRFSFTKAAYNRLKQSQIKKQTIRSKIPSYTHQLFPVCTHIFLLTQ